MPDSKFFAGNFGNFLLGGDWVCGLLPAGHHLCLAVALSEAKPTGEGQLQGRFPTGNHQPCSKMIPCGNISLCDAVRGFRYAQRPG